MTSGDLGKIEKRGIDLRPSQKLAIGNVSLEHGAAHDKTLADNPEGRRSKDSDTCQVQPPSIEDHDTTHNGEGPESEQAHIERLGRERPVKFKSLGAELAFCYSVIASQFMAVSLAYKSWPFVKCSHAAGILCIWIQPHPSHIDDKARYPTSLSSMAV